MPHQGSGGKKFLPLGLPTNFSRNILAYYSLLTIHKKIRMVNDKFLIIPTLPCRHSFFWLMLVNRILYIVSHIMSIKL